MRDDQNIITDGDVRELRKEFYKKSVGTIILLVFLSVLVNNFFYYDTALTLGLNLFSFIVGIWLLLDEAYDLLKAYQEVEDHGIF